MDPKPSLETGMELPPSVETPNNAPETKEKEPAPSLLPGTETERQEKSREVGFDNSPEARVRDVLSLAGSGLSAEQGSQLATMLASENSVSTQQLEQFFPDPKDRREWAKTLATTLESKVKASGFVERVKLFFTKTNAHTNERAMLLARALQWQGEQSGRQDIRVLYPASGEDTIDVLRTVGNTPLEQVTCVTDADRPFQQALQKVEKQGKKAEAVTSYLGEAMKADKEGNIAVPEGSADCLLVDASGVGALMETQKEFGDARLTDTINRLVPEGGTIVAIKAISMGSNVAKNDTTIRAFISRLPPGEYRFVAETGDGFIIQRVKKEKAALEQQAA